MTAPRPPAGLSDRLARFAAPLGRKIVFHRLDRLPPRQPRAEIIGGLAAAGEVVALVGAPGCGKSAVATLLTRCIAEGTTFLDRTASFGAVVYVAAERAAEVERRLNAAVSANAPVYVTSARPQLADPSSVGDLVESLALVSADALVPIKSIIIDTAARCFRALDENSSRDVGLAAEGLARIAKACPSALVLIIHHLAKSGDGMRGSGALLGAVDLELTVRKEGNRRSIRVTKANAVEEGQELVFRLTPVNAADGLTVITAEAVGPGPSAASSKAGPRLPPDAATALDKLRELCAAAETVTFDDWREATFQAFGDRSQHSKRQAWSKAHRQLAEASHVVIDGQNVSVSEASANRQHGVSADAGKASAPTVSAPPSRRGGADAADARRHQASKRKR